MLKSCQRPPAPVLTTAALLAAALLGSDATRAAESNLVYPGASGRLLYATQADGDRIPDFSAVGYKYGQEAIPTNISPALVVAPGSGDDTARIQNAINQVSSLPIGSNGFRGVVQLTAGEYQIATSLNINASGVVLRGMDDGDSPANSTILRGTGTTQRSLVNVAITNGSTSWTMDPTKISPVTDKYVPVGATSFRIASPQSYAQGDTVRVFRPSTAEWISDIGMDSIPPDGGTLVQWAPGSKDRYFDRVITRIEGDRIFLNAPITQSLDEQYGGGYLRKYEFPSRLHNVGIESIRGVSDYTSPDDEDHAWTFIQINGLEHGWVRNVTGQHFGFAAVSLVGATKNITVDDAHSIDPVSLLAGGRRYSFNLSSNAELNLLQNLTADQGRHDFIMNSASVGPNVFYNAVATNAHADSGVHQRWSIGGLFDNVTTDNNIDFENGSNSGSGHGWRGANFVVWNSQASGFIVQNPPTAQNWAIGNIGTITNVGRETEPLGIVDQHGAHVDTQSLYLKQLQDRLAVANSEFREYVTGDYDNYVNDGGSSVDNVTVSPSLTAEFADFFATQGLPLKGFDDTATNAFAPHSWQFGIDDDEQVYHAVMTLAVKRTGGSTVDDSIWFERVANELPFTVLGLGSQINSAVSTMIMVEYTGTDLGWFNDGEFNVVIGDDVAVDWGRLDLVVGDLLSGDVNADGILNAADVALFSAALQAGNLTSFNNAQPTGRYIAGDFTGDGLVTMADFNAFSSAILDADPSAADELNAIPTPATLVLLGCGVAACARRRRLARVS